MPINEQCLSLPNHLSLRSLSGTVGVGSVGKQIKNYWVSNYSRHDDERTKYY